MGEFELIACYFTRPAKKAVLGVGDDCALWQPRVGMQLAVSSDMLVSGRHFFPNVDPYTLGHKALAVNLSDLAACGATPLAFTLALALPDANAHWLEPFSRGLLALADAHQCELIGGDTTQGPLTISITVLGEIPVGKALLRSGAQAADDIYVSGTLGDAALALHAQLGDLPEAAPRLSTRQWAQARQRLECPIPRVALGQALRGIANAAADISDGLLGDLGHILTRSHVGATIDTDAALARLATPHTDTKTDNHTEAVPHPWLRYVLAGGDDYELVFTAPRSQREQVALAAHTSQTPVARIGTIDAEPGLRLIDAQGRAVTNDYHSFDHFS